MQRTTTASTPDIENAPDDTPTEATPAPTRPADPGQADATPDTMDGPESANREARQYRLRLRQAEAERDGLAARVDALQRAEVERLAGIKPAALWASGVQLADLLNPDGTVSPDMVQAATTAAIDAFGLAQPSPRSPNAGKISRDDGRGRWDDAWQQALTGEPR